MSIIFTLKSGTTLKLARICVCVATSEKMQFEEVQLELEIHRFEGLSDARRLQWYKTMISTNKYMPGISPTSYLTEITRSCMAKVIGHTMFTSDVAVQKL